MIRPPQESRRDCTSITADAVRGNGGMLRWKAFAFACFSRTGDASLAILSKIYAIPVLHLVHHEHALYGGEVIESAKMLENELLVILHVGRVDFQ